MKMKNVKLFESFQTEDKINENVSADFDEVFGALGYQGFDDFLEDNPGAVDALLDWIGSVPEFIHKLKDIDIMSGYIDENKSED